jgi:DNA-directed RNA polymerase specialized sigma24 family protein
LHPSTASATKTRYELDDDRGVLRSRAGRGTVTDDMPQPDMPQPDMPQPDGGDGLRDRFAAGDATALEEAYDRYAPAVYHLATAAVTGSGRAEEATTMAFAAAWHQRAEAPAGPMSFLAWLLHQTCDAVATLNRGRGPDGRALDLLVGRLVIADELAGLPDRERLAVRDVLDGKRSLAEIAADRQISVGEAEQEVLTVVRRLKQRWERDSATRRR